MADSFAGQSHIAVTFSAGDLTPKPARRFESLATRVAWKFHFRHHQTMIAAVINVDLNFKIFPRNLVARFPQSPSRRGRPERRKLLRAQPNLPFFPDRRPSDLAPKEVSLAFFVQPASDPP